VSGSNEVWNQQRVESIDRLMARHAVIHDLPHAQRRTDEGARRIQAVSTVSSCRVSDIHIDVLRTIVEGNHVAVHCRVTATHDGRRTRDGAPE
jgi:hypothetical protein